MNKRSLTCIVVGVAVLLVLGVELLLLPWLQGARAAVETRTSLALERARRLFDKFDASLARNAVLVEQLTNEGIDPNPQDVADSLTDAYQQLHTSLWETYRPNDWPQGASPKPAKAGYGNVQAQVREGISGEEALIEKNDGSLENALEAVEEALSMSQGEESSETHAEAMRLKGTILKYMGAADQIEAQQRRRETDAYRYKLAAFAAKVVASQSAAGLVESSGVDALIVALKARIVEAESAARENRRSLEALESRIAEFERRLTDMRARQDEAWSSMQKLQAAGMDLANPDGAETFRRRLETLSDVYRKAAREVHSLEFGTLTTAKGEQPRGAPTGSTGIGLSGDHSAALGLRHYRDERTVLAARVAGLEQTATGLHSDLARLEGDERMLQASQDRAAQQISEVVAAASDVYAELDRIDSEAFAIEENALGLLEESAQLSEQAAKYTQDWISEAGTRTRGMSPEQKERSAFGVRLDDGWMAGFATAQVADARMAKAWIYCSRYRAYLWTADILGKVVGPLQLKEADAESERAKAKEAHDLGVEEISEAIKALEEAHKDTGRHWTLTAQAAGATYMLALFGHQDYVGDAVEAYRLAIKGRENQDAAKEYVARLNRLQKEE